MSSSYYGVNGGASGFLTRTSRRRSSTPPHQLLLALILLLLCPSTTSAFLPQPRSSPSRRNRASFLKSSDHKGGRRSATTLSASSSSSNNNNKPARRTFQYFSNNTAAFVAYNHAAEETSSAASSILEQQQPKDEDLLIRNEIIYNFPTLSATATTITKNGGGVLEQQQPQSSPHQTLAVLEDISMVTDSSVAASTTQVASLDDEASTTISGTQQQQDQQQAVQWARLLLLGAAALYGTNFSCVKLLGDTLPVGISSTLRFGMAALATAPWLLQGVAVAQSENGGDANGTVEHNPDSAASLPQTTATTTTTSPAEAWGAIVAGLEVGMWNSVGYVAQAVGLETTLASKSAFLCSLAVVTVPILDWVTGKRLKQREWLGAVVALVGVGFLELGGGEGLQELLHFSAGDVASLMQPLAFGLGFWRMERAMRLFPEQATRSTAAQLLAVFLGSLAYTAATDAHALLDVAQLQQWLSDPHIVGALLWTGAVTTALSVYMETLALKTLSAAETTLIFSTEPVWGSLFAAWFMGETFGWDAWAGGALILTACVYSNLGWQGLRDLVLPSAVNGGGKENNKNVGDDVLP